MTCRRVEVRCAVSPPQVRSAISGIIRRRDQAIAVPSPFEQRELLVLGSKSVSLRRVRTDTYQADLLDRGAISPLTLDREEDRRLVALLLERAFVVAFEQDPCYWRLFDTTRNWYRREPVTVVDGIQVIPRVSFSTISLGEEGVGVAFDSGYLYRTDMTVADYFDTTVGRGERQERIRRFERLRTRGEQRKGTLLYDTRHDDLSVCYFERFEEGMTCDATGPIRGKESLYEYCRDKHPEADVQPGDSVACVSFRSRNLPHPVLVPAKMLRLRVMADKGQSVRGLGQFKTSPPTSRRDEALRAWDICGASVARSVGVRFEDGLWRPTRHELLACPSLEFGKGRTVPPPERQDLGSYQRYFRQRLDKLRGGGLLHYDEAVERKLHIVTPRAGNGWTDELQQAFVSDFSATMKDITGLQFRVTTVREDDPDQIVEALGESNPGTTVIVFDDRAADSAAYFLLAHGLSTWKLKRLTRRQVQDKWEARRGRNADETRKAEQRWKDMITLSVLDTLDQMGAVPWRIKSFPYDACLAIDVGEGRRYFAMSLLICRDERRSPSFLRLSKAWHKGDHQHEAINPVMLRDKVVQLLGGFPNSEFSPLQSLLVLRDGRQCSDEPRGLSQAVDRLKQKGRLVQGAIVDVVDVHKKTVKNLRIWETSGEGCENVLEGRAVYLGDGTALMCCTGAATLSRNATADPCMLVMREGADVRKAARAFFALSQLNYSSPSKAHRYAHPLRETDVLLQQRLAQDMRGIR